MDDNIDKTKLIDNTNIIMEDDIDKNKLINDKKKSSCAQYFSGSYCIFIFLSLLC